MIVLLAFVVVLALAYRLLSAGGAAIADAVDRALCDDWGRYADG